MSKQMEIAVIELLKSGPKSAHEMREQLGLPNQSQNQILDRALQKLRKSGNLQRLNGRWSLPTVKICPTCNGRGWV